MDAEAVEINRISPGHRPTGRPAGYHTWSDLLFAHWRLPAHEVAPLLPPPLTLDTWQGDAWVGLVPFRMSGVRPRWWPWGASFLETNVRTYVHLDGRDPGVWFFSLEANHWLAVKVARAAWHLNYHWARMSLKKTGNVIRYEGRRRAEPAGSCVEARVMTHSPLSTAAAGTLEHFLVERYFLYAAGEGRLWRGQVHHRPYLVQPADLLHIEESLLATNGIRPNESPCHVLYSPRVDVEVFGLIPVANGVW
ncbi:MAG TPA: DUF2071 domain-containing protein [Pirellulales bacterium]|nr:DUF2071 domain-containing protein [Pirellulales bacterium]